MTKVMVIVPTAARPEVLTVETLFGVARRVRRWCELDVRIVAGYSCEMARNEGVRLFLESDAQWLWMVDSDMALPDWSLEQLLGAGEPVVSGVYFRKLPGERIAEVCRLEEDATVFFREDEIPDHLFEAAGVGCGCVLLRRDAVEAASACGRMFVYQIEPELISEDLWMCNLLRGLGYRIMVDPAVRCGHIGRVVY